MATEPLIRMLTSADVSLSLGQTKAIPGARQRALFVALALEPNSQISRDWLADLLWPNASQSQARQRLRMTLLNLRKALDKSREVTVEANNEAIWLHAKTEDVDVALFEQLAENPTSWSRALDHYKGNLLSNFPTISDEFDDYLSTRRERLKEHFLTIALQLLRGAKRDRDAAGFERAYQASVRADPVNETAAILAMEFWSSEGLADRVEAVFRQHEASLEKHHGAPVEPQVSQSFETLVQKARATPTSSMPGVTFQSANAAAEMSRSKSRHWLFGALAVVAIVVGAAFIVLQDRFRSAGGPIFLVLKPMTSFTNCALETPLQASNGAILEVLRSFEDSVVVVGNLRRYFVLPNEGAYLVRQHIECSDTRFRATFTFVDRKTRAVAASIRSSGLPIERQGLADQIADTINLTPER